MKKFLKSAGLPIGVFALAIGSAFATNAIKSSNLFATEDGYQKLDSQGVNCVKIMDCSTVFGPTCTWEESPGVVHQLYGKQQVENQTLCTKILYKIQ